MSSIFHSEIKISKQFAKTIYAYKNKQYDKMIKIGETSRDPIKRIEEQLISAPFKSYEILNTWDASSNEMHDEISDGMIHKILKEKGYKNHSEFFEVDIDTLNKLMAQIKSGIKPNDIILKTTYKREGSFPLRKEQKTAIEMTSSAFRKGINKFLWNAKMRFGKTFTSYKLIEKNDFKNILMITYKPSVIKSWIEDLNTHVDFEGWGYQCKIGKEPEKQNAISGKPNIVFKSFQDVKGRHNNNVKDSNAFLYKEEFDLVIFDEYHFGSWNDNSKNEFAKEMKTLDDYQKWLSDETNDTINGKYKLYLSGTPFRILDVGEFSDDQVFTWSYTDEQNEKMKPENKSNTQYQSLPKMIMMGYELPKDICDKYLDEEGVDFSLNKFFKTDKNTHKFIFENDVKTFLRWISGYDAAKDEKSPKPFFDSRLIDYVDHTYWMLPSVSAVYALKELLESGVSPIFKDYKVIVAADSKVKNGAQAYDEVKNAIKTNNKTITLSAGMLNTGTTIKEWKAVFMLSDTKSAETYFQTAFRAQSPLWKYDSSKNEDIILKDICYIFDFSPFRAFRMIYNQTKKYGDENNKTKEQKIDDVLKVLPVLSMQGSGMKMLKADEIIDLVVHKTTGTLLARKWESPLLVNVTNRIMEEILKNPNVMEAIMRIKGFRTLNKDFELIVNKTKKIKESNMKEHINASEKKGINKEKKEMISKRKEIQNKLIKFAARIPIFMYLTDSREIKLYDLITTHENELFHETTGLTTQDFELLNTVGLFNNETMDDAVWGFRRYEDDSFNYIGISKRDGDKIIGGFRSHISKDELLTKHDPEQN